MADLPTPAPKPDLSQIPNGALNGAAAQLAAQSGPRFVLPHMQQFQAVWKTPAGTYRFSFDEALKRSHTDALAMRRDGHLIHLLQARYLPVLGADWHIKADDEQDEERAKTYQALLEKTPRFLQLRKCLLEAVWFGRYGVQLAFGTIEVNGRQMQGITAWRPVNGDKINFREDGTPTVRINPAFAARLRDDGATIEDAEKHPHTAWNDQGTVLVLDQPRYRQRFAIHVHEVEDADFSEPELAGGVGGVGLRHYCYWVWWLRQEVMEWLLNYLEMMGAGGLTIVGYDAGNPKGLDLAQQAFEERATVVYLPIPPGQEKQTNLVQRIEPSGTGNDIFHGWIDGYFNAILTRLIIGQDLSSQSSGTGLGSGVADLQADVKQCIHRYDARNLNETETQQLLNVLIALNEPSGNTNLRCETVLKEKEPEKALQAAKQAFDMGAELPESFVVKTAGIPEPKKGERLLSQAQQQQQQEALTSAVAGGHASAAGIGLGEMRNYLDAQGIPEEEQLHHLADMVDGGELQEIDTDDGVKYVEAGQYQDTPPSQDQPKTYAKEDWIEETGPRGGKRWTNRKSGTVQYKEPGEGRTGPKDAQIEEPAQEGDKPVAKLRKGMVAQGAYQYADKALRGESNKTLEGEGVLAHVVNLDKRLVKSQVVSLAAQHGMPVSASTTKTRALAFIEDKLRGHLDAHLKQQKGGKAGKERVDSEEAGGAASPAVGANQAQGTMPAASPALPGQATPAPTAEGEYPASAPPGSEERIRLMAERAAQKKPLFGQEEKPNVVQTNAGGFPEAAPARDGTPEVLGQGGSGGGEHPGERAVLEDGAGGGTEAGQEQGQEEGHLPPRQDETLNQYCKRAGIQEAYPHVKAHALQLHQLQREQVDKHNDIVRTAMKALKKESGLVTSRLVAQRGKDGNVDTAKGERAKDDLTKWNKLWSKAKDGGDYASLPGFDQITREIASEHTDLFKGAYRTEGGDDSTGTALDDQEKLFGMLVEGVRPVPDFREAEDQALQDYEESRANHRRATGESADNAESGDTSFEPEFMGEDEAREHLAEHLTPEEMPGTMEAAQENQDAILQGDAPDSGAAEHDRADEGGAQPRQGEEDRASPGEGEREGQGQSPYAQKVDELPPIPEGHGRLTHVTTKQGVDQILKGGLDYSRQGIDATTDIHNGNESIHDLAKTGNVAGTGFNRNKFGDQVVLSDLSEDEYRKHADLTGGAPGSIHPSRIVGHIDRTTGKFTPNPQYNPNAQVDVGSSAPEPMPVGPRARRPGSGGTAPISGAESVPVPVPSGKAEVWGDEEAPPASDFMQQEQKSGPHTPESVAESAGQSFTNDKGLTVDVRKNADGTWNVGSLTNVSRAAVANYLNSHGAMRAPGLFKDDVTAQRGHDYDENEAVAKERERAHTMALGDMDPEWFHGAESWAVQGSQLKVKKELDGTYTVTSHNPKYPSLGEQHISKGLPRDMTMNNIWRGRFVPSQGTGEFDRLVDKGIRSLRARAKRPEWAAQTKPQGGPELPGMKDAFAPGMFGEAKTEEEAKPTEPKTTHPLGHYSRTTEDGTSVEPLREGERPISKTIRVQHAKGYRGKLGNTSYVAKINGTSSRYGLEREFQKADRMDWGDSKLFKKNKGVYHAEHDVPPQGGVYEVNEHGEKRFGVHVPLKWNGKSKLMEYRVGEEGLKTAYQMLERAGRKPSELVTAFVHTADQKAMKTPERVKKYLEDLEAQEPAASPNLAEIQHEPSSAPARPESPASPAATPGPAGEEVQPEAEAATGEQLPPGVSRDAIPYDLAYNAHRGTSFVPERRAKQRQDDYIAQMKADWEHLSKYAKTDEEKKQLAEEFTRYASGYADHYKNVLHAASRTMSPMITGPARFPVASNNKRLETEHRRHNDLTEFRKRALGAIRKKVRPEQGAIQSNQFNAVELLQKQLEPLRRLQETMVKANKIVQQHTKHTPGKFEQGDYTAGKTEYKSGKTEEGLRAELKQTGLSDKMIGELLRPSDFGGGKLGFEPFQLSNNNANIRRIEKRIEELSKMKAMPGSEKQYSGGVKVVEDPDAARIRIHFPGKPERSTIDTLKSSGFRWSPSEGAWQRHLNSGGRYAVESVLEKLGHKPEEATPDAAEPEGEGIPETIVNDSLEADMPEVEPAKADAYDRLHQKLGMPDTAFPSLRSMASATSTKQLPTYATPDAAREHVSHAYSTAPAHSPDDAKAHWERMAGLERLGKNDLADVAKAANVHIPPGTTREIAANLIRNAYARRRGASLRAEMTAPGAKGAIGQLPLLPERAEAAVKPAGNLDPVKMDVMSKPELLGHAEKMELYGLGKKSRQEIAAAIRAKLGE